MKKLPAHGSVVVLAGDPAWAPLVASRNSSGSRSALLLAGSGDGDPLSVAREMAAELGAAAPWETVDVRGMKPADELLQ